jgi:hypothetical protein
LLLGFDRLERLVERTARAGTDGYPPFNIEVTGQNSFASPLPWQGFAKKICPSPSRNASFWCAARNSTMAKRMSAFFCIAALPRASFSAPSRWQMVWMWRKRGCKTGFCIST